MVIKKKLDAFIGCNKSNEEKAMKFDANGYPKIKQAVLSKEDIQFEIDKNHTHFKGTNNLPSNWTEYPPVHLSEDGLKLLLTHLSLEGSTRATFFTIEQSIWLSNGKVKYKKFDDDTVTVKFSW